MRSLLFTGAALGMFTVSNGSGAEPINIPLRTWIAIPAPEYGAGACPHGECKHIRVTQNPVNGRLYFAGGDYFPGSCPAGASCLGSQNNEMWSYDVASNNWRLETSYCLPPGNVQPNGFDEVGFPFDTRRNMFWMVPGF